MSVQTAAREQAVAAAIREISHIATLPEITLKIIHLVEEPTSTAQDLHNVISKDPALCTRILKVVNSAFYGLPGQIGSINRAIVLLGLNAVKNIAIAASLAKLFKGGQLTPGFSAKDLWTHSITTATAMKLLSAAMKLSLPDEAFLAGLIHDVGVMVELQYDRNRLVEVLERCEAAPCDMLAVEAEIFHADHQDFGAGLCEKWKFPRTFTLACGHHHRPMELPADQRILPCMVAVADRISASLSAGFRLDVPDASIPSDLLDELKLTRGDVDDIKTRLPEHLADVERILA
jgi:HD-like signal output (HDOD) protein